MTYKSKIVVHKNFDSSWARDSLISEFLRKHKGIFNFSVEFEETSFEDYPDLKDLEAFLSKEYRNRKGDLFWCGTKYDTMHDLYADLSKQKNILKIIINYTKN